MHSLPLFLRLQGRPVILLGAGAAADAKRRLLERAGAKIVGEEAEAALAIIAMEDAALAETAYARLKARGILINTVDRLDLCDFTLPAVVDRDPVIVAIGTGGASAGLAKVLRQRLELLLPAGLGALAHGLRDAREAMRARWPSPAERRRAIDRALGGRLDPMCDQDEAAVTHWLDTVEGAEDGPSLVKIGIASDDPDELSLRAARLLGQADRVYHAAGIAPAILDRARADAERIPGEPPQSLLPGLSLHLVPRSTA